MSNQRLFVSEEVIETLQVEAGWSVEVGKIVGHGEEFACILEGQLSRRSVPSPAVFVLLLRLHDLVERKNAAETLENEKDKQN